LLVDKSLVVAERRDGATRYRLLETLRHYAEERLEAAGEAAAVRARHRNYFLTLAEAAEAALQSPEQAAWLARLEEDHDNLRAALAWCRRGCEDGSNAASGDHESWLRLVGALWRFWWQRGYLSEGRAWLDEGLAAGGAALPAPRAKALNAAGALAYAQGDYARATACWHETVALRRQIGDTRGLAAALANLGVAAKEQGDYDRAAALHEESLALQRGLGDSRGIASGLLGLGNVAHMQGHLDRAAALFEESLDLHRQLGDRAGIAFALNNLGIVAQDHGDCARATALHEQCLALYRDMGDRTHVAGTLSNLGIVARLQGDGARAAELQREALAIRWDIGDRLGIIVCLSELAAVAVLQDNPLRAARLRGAAEAQRETIGVPATSAYHADHAQVLAAVRAALDADAFAAAWAAGQALTPEEAIAEALSANDEAPTPVEPGPFADLTDEQWQAVAPLLPPRPARGRPRRDDRQVITGILYVLSTGCRWMDLPDRYGSDTTAWQRYQALRAAGVWDELMRTLRQHGYRTDRLTAP
jgi:transposase